MKLLCAWLLLLFTSSACLAGKTDFVIPTKSPFVHSRTEGLNVIEHFSGNVRISGVLHFEKFEYGIRADIIPDKKSQALLPYNLNKGPVQAVTLSWEQAQEFAKLLPQDTRKKLESGTYPSVEISVVVFATDYISGADCDHQWYTFQSLRLVAKQGKFKPQATASIKGGCG
jgi:hypothetical protein